MLLHFESCRSNEYLPNLLKRGLLHHFFFFFETSNCAYLLTYFFFFNFLGDKSIKKIQDSASASASVFGQRLQFFQVFGLWLWSNVKIHLRSFTGFTEIGVDDLLNGLIKCYINWYHFHWSFYKYQFQTGQFASVLLYHVLLEIKLWPQIIEGVWTGKNACC